MASIVAGFLFVYWLQSVGGLRRQAIYQIRFESPVSGLLKGSAVHFNGIRVGEVTNLGLNADDPKQVTVTVAIDPATPVRADTRVEIEFQGLTGATVISLKGGSATAPPLRALSGEPPLLVADEAATQSLTQAAREALRRLDAILADNAEPLKSTLGNLNTFSAALARNSDKLDGIVAGLERLTGGGKKGPVTTYDLSAPRTFPPLEKVVRAQLVVPEPGAPIALDTQKIVPRSAGAEAASFVNAQWSDTVPKLVQAKIIQALDNSGYLSAVSRPMDGLAADYQLLIDIRAFQIAAAPGEAAEVELAAKVLGNGGRIVAGKVFAAKALRGVCRGAGGHCGAGRGLRQSHGRAGGVGRECAAGPAPHRSGRRAWRRVPSRVALDDPDALQDAVARMQDHALAGRQAAHDLGVPGVARPHLDDPDTGAGPLDDEHGPGLALPEQRAERDEQGIRRLVDDDADEHAVVVAEPAPLAGIARERQHDLDALLLDAERRHLGEAGGLDPVHLGRQLKPAPALDDGRRPRAARARPRSTGARPPARGSRGRRPPRAACPGGRPARSPASTFKHPADDRSRHGDIGGGLVGAGGRVVGTGAARERAFKLAPAQLAVGLGAGERRLACVDIETGLLAAGARRSLASSKGRRRVRARARRTCNSERACASSASASVTAARAASIRASSSRRPLRSRNGGTLGSITATTWPLRTS